MKIDQKIPPREFKISKSSEISIKDVASITLGEDEQVTFTNEDKEFDVCKKKWGFYATPSTNRRLKSFGYLTCLCTNESGSIYVLVVDENYEDDFYLYIRDQNMKILSWLNDDFLIKQEKGS